MISILAVNFAPKDFKALEGAIKRDGKRRFALFRAEDSDTDNLKSPDLALLYWRRGAKDQLIKYVSQAIPAAVVFGKQSKAAFKEALALGAADCFVAGEVSTANLEMTLLKASAIAGAKPGLPGPSAKYETFMKNAPAVAFIKDKEGRYLYVNAMWERISQKKLKDVAGKTMEELWPSETAGRMRQDDQEVLQTGVTKKVVEWIPINGERRLFITHKFPLFDEGGATSMIAGMSMDVTDIEKVKVERDITERKYRHLFESALDGIIVADPQTLDILDSNEVFASSLGYSVEELLKMKISQIAPDINYATDRVLAFLREGGPVTFERILTRKDGSKMPVEVRGKILDLAGSRVLVGFVRDISDRQKAERELMESQLRYKTVIEAAHDAIFMADAETGILIDANSMAEKLMGYPREELIGAHQSKLHPTESEKEYKTRFKDSVTQGSAPEEYLFIQRKDGKKTPVEVGVSVAQIGGRKIIVGIFRDVTRRLQAENEIKRKTDLTRLLKDISVEANEAGAAESALMTAITKIREFTGWDLGHVYIVGQDELIRSSGLISCSDHEMARKFRRLTDAFIFSQGEGLPGRVCQSGKPVWSLDMVSQNICVRDRAMVNIGLRAAFAFPVLEGKKTAAVLEFFATGMEEPDETMLEAINGLAIQLGRVTERKKINEKLQLAQRIIDTAKEGIVITDDEANIQSVNRAFSELTGYAPEEVIGKNPRILKSGKHDRRFYEKMWDSLLVEGSWEGEIWNRRKDGRAYPELLSITAIKDDHGNTAKYAAIF
ncbi:MAG: PAS domain S-box protein, partial [Nitrospinota bacterium]|nr:PAS domain S-box protein [Nitrospinota bacterium]